MVSRASTWTSQDELSQNPGKLPCRQLPMSLGFGSRQEEAQRLGRILRPKERTSRFFTLITRNTVEEDFGSNRQKFLAEQGYSYRILRYNDESSLDELDSTAPLCIDGFGAE